MSRIVQVKEMQVLVMTLEDRILGYIDHLNNAPYLDSILADRPTPELLRLLARMLRSHEAQDVIWTCLVIRDLINFGPRNAHGEAFRDLFPESEAVQQLERLILDGRFFVRANAIYALGKIGSTRSLPAMHQAFDVLLERDPVLLPGLAEEIWWLEEHTTWSLVERMVEHTYFAVRWAVFGMGLWVHGVPYEEPLRSIHSRSFERLRRDPSELVRAEAEFHFQTWAFEQSKANLSREEKRQQSREVEHLRPQLSFESIRIMMSNRLHIQNIADYSVADLEAFISAQVAQSEAPST